MKADIAIAGGGVIGALAAYMLARRLPDLKIAVMDAAPKNSRDPRTLALAYKTQQLLQQEGLWRGEASRHAAAIEHIHVSDRGSLGSSTIQHEKHGVQTLGHVVSAHYLQRDLEKACAGQKNISWLHETRAGKVEQSQDAIRVALNDNGDKQLSARLLVAADGARSGIREQLGIRLRSHNYEQVAMIANLKLDRNHQHWAWERFTEHGPIALLPKGPQEVALVWCVGQQQAGGVAALSDTEFLRAVQSEFGFRAGRFISVSDRASYPLHLLLAERAIHHRTVIMGNACHTLHPIAGQGYNLGARDVEALVRHVAQSALTDPGCHRTLLAYEKDRLEDYQRITQLTDGLVRVFSNRYLPFVAVRNIGLLALRGCPALNYPLARLAMGYRATAPGGI